MERDGIDLGAIAPGGPAALGPSGRSVTQQGDTSYNTRKHLTSCVSIATCIVQNINIT